MRIISQIRVFNSLRGGDNGIIIKNLNFETRFQKFVFSSPQNAIVVSVNVKTHKKIFIFSVL